VLTVERGRVICPRFGVVDVERCWACPWYEGLTSGPAENVICRVEVAGMPFSVRMPVR
jgi:hypothetical protein